MARWKLTEQCYLRVPGTKWEYHEVDRVTGRPKRVQFEVPLYLNPHDSGDWNYKNGDDGEIIVSDGNNSQPKDIIFTGPPNVGMLPIDDDAKGLTAQQGLTPTQGIDDLSQSESYANKLIVGLLDKMSTPQANTGTPAGMPELLSSIAAMMKQNQEILEQLVKSDRRKVA
jgi:hypothetical protein